MNFIKVMTHTSVERCGASGAFRLVANAPSVVIEYYRERTNDRTNGARALALAFALDRTPPTLHRAASSSRAAPSSHTSN